MDGDIKAYFDAIYVASSKSFVYGENKATGLDVDEGVKQGDAMSAFYFCVLMDIVAYELHALHPDAQLFFYMDDMSIACNPEKVSIVSQDAVLLLLEYGFRPNVAKSSCIHKDNIDLQCALPQNSCDDKFNVLGANISSNYDRFNDTVVDKIHTFFKNLLDAEGLHPQLVWTILRLCGSPKLIYYSSTTPPDQTTRVLDYWDYCIGHCVERIVGGAMVFNKAMLHDKLGGGIPNYKDNTNSLYEVSKTAALTQNTSSSKITLGSLTDRLLTDTQSSADVRSQHDAQYLFYGGSSTMRLSESHFVTALCIRMRQLPRHYDVSPTTCACGQLIATSSNAIDHALKCDRFTYITHGMRHNILRDAFCTLTRTYGVTTTVEPRCFLYTSGRDERPDAIFHLPKTIVTDFTIVSPKDDVGAAASKAADNKITTHAAAVERLSMTFIPAACESYGHVDEKFHVLIKEIGKQLPNHLQWSFAREALHVVSSALAKGRALAIISMAIGVRNV
jgi:hypothetical protein